MICSTHDLPEVKWDFPCPVLQTLSLSYMTGMLSRYASCLLTVFMWSFSFNLLFIFWWISIYRLSYWSELYTFWYHEYLETFPVIVSFFRSFSFYNTKSVVMCLGITAAVCLVVTVFSFQSKVRKIIFIHSYIQIFLCDIQFAWLAVKIICMCQVVLFYTLW